MCQNGSCKSRPRMVVRRYIGYWNDFINAFNRGFNLLKENMVSNLTLKVVISLSYDTFLAHLPKSKVYFQAIKYVSLCFYSYCLFLKIKYNTRRLNIAILPKIQKIATTNEDCL
jgi:hypothetical protein